MCLGVSMLRFLSVRFRYCDQLKLSESTQILQPYLPSVLEGLVQLAAQFSSEVLTLVMETLCIVCSVDPAFTTSAENKICPLTIAIFLKYSNGNVFLFFVIFVVPESSTLFP